LAIPDADFLIMAAETPPAAATADRLSEVLRRCGALENGLVSDVTVDSSRATILSVLRPLMPAVVAATPEAKAGMVLHVHD
jgi:hypothetical protein